MHWFHEFIDWYFQQMNHIGLELYVFLGMTIESTFLPLPSEIIMPPAAHQAASNGGFARVLGLILLGTAGSIAGAYFNYFVFGRWLGRPILEKYGKYFFIGPRHLAKIDHFWERYGEASTFIGRLVPGVRHLISVPAGLSGMPLWKFTLYTGTGAGFWVTVLAMTGWFLRDWTMADFETKLKGQMTPYVLGGIGLMVVGYLVWTLTRRKAKTS